MSIFLPEGWQEAFDPSTQHTYYYNDNTGETSWSIPLADASWKPSRTFSKEEAAILIQKLWKARLARRHMKELLKAVYEKVYDPASGQYYYYNNKTGQTSWNQPKGLVDADPDKQTKVIASNTTAKTTHILKSGVEVPIEWEEAFDASTQHVYYYNTKTGQTSWSTPKLTENWKPFILTEEEAVKLIQSLWRSRLARRQVRSMLKDVLETVKDPETGRTYYYNSQTGESSWSKPAILGNEKILNSVEKTEIKVWGNRVNRSKEMSRQGDWIEFWDNVDSICFFHNAVSANCQWEPPEDWVLENSDDDGQDTPSDNIAVHLIDSTGEEDNQSEKSEFESKSFVTASKKRKYPRSKAQSIVDAAEDLECSGKEATIIDLSNLTALKVTSRLWDLEHLETLILSNNRLTRIPSGIQDLCSLTHLDISKNNLDKLPGCLHTSTSIKVLKASGNNIKTFSPKLWKLCALEVFDLCDNSILELPYTEGDLKLLRETSEWEVGIGVCKELKYLNLSSNLLEVFPKTLEKCVNLKYLNLSNNRITEVNGIGSLCHLEELYLSQNRITIVPDTIGNLTSVVKFDISNNMLDEIPENFGELKSLRELSIDCNSISSLPVELGFLFSLEKLSMDNNPGLQVLPNRFDKVTKICDLSANNCGLVDIPSTLFHPSSKFQKIELVNNKLLSIPDTICNALQNFEVANFKQNFFTKVPVVLYSCCSILDLNFSKNKINAIPEGIACLIALQKLDLSHNILNCLPTDFVSLKNLKILSLSHNKLSFLPLSIGKMTNLEFLDVSHNKLTAIPTSCEDLRHLNFFNLSNNAFCIRPPILNYLEENHHCIRVLNLNNNPALLSSRHENNSKFNINKALKFMDLGEFDKSELILTSIIEETNSPEISFIKNDLLSISFFRRGLVYYKQMLKAFNEVDIHANNARTAQDEFRYKYWATIAKNRKIFSNLSNLNSQQLEVLDGLPMSSDERECFNVMVQTIQIKLDLKDQAKKKAFYYSKLVLDDLQKSLNYEYEKMTCHIVMGLTFRCLKKYAKAIVSFTKALQITILADVLLKRADIYSLIGQNDLAEKDREFARIVDLAGNGNAGDLISPEMININSGRSHVEADVLELRLSRNKMKQDWWEELRVEKEMRDQKVRQVKGVLQEIEENRVMVIEDDRSLKFMNYCEQLALMKSKELAREVMECEHMHQEEKLQRNIISQQKKIKEMLKKEREILEQREKSKEERRKKISRRGGKRSRTSKSK